MKKISKLLLPLLFIVQFSFSQDSLKQSPTSEPQWHVGLHAAPLFRNRSPVGIAGFRIMPGIYRSTGRIMYGFTPSYSHTSDTYQATSNEPQDINTWTTNSYGGIFQFRYYLNDNRLRPYILVQGGFAYNEDKLSRLPQFGGSFSENYWEFNMGAGFGATYKINDNWSVDGNIIFDMQKRPNRDLEFTGYITLGIFRKIGK